MKPILIVDDEAPIRALIRLTLERAGYTCDEAATGTEAAGAFDLTTAGHRVFVVDPLGQIILRYATDADPKDILKDMDRLLRYAWAG